MPVQIWINASVKLMKTPISSSEMVSYYSLFYLTFIALHLPEMIGVVASAAAGGEECKKERRCDQERGGPAVRFPFRLRGHHPPHCGRPDPEFELSCDENKLTMLNLTKVEKLFVKKINYELQQIEIYDPVGNCLPRLPLQNPNFNLSASPFRYVSTSDPYNVLVNCSIDEQVHMNDDYEFIGCLSIPAGGYGVKLISVQYRSVVYLTGCLVIDVKPFLLDYYNSYMDTSLQLHWLPTDCSECYEAGYGCSQTPKIECLRLPSTGRRIRKFLIKASIFLGIFLLTIVAAIGVYHIISSNELKRKREMKIKQFLVNYKALKSTRYSYADIKSFTNNFKEKLGQGAFGTVYKGTLVNNNIPVAIKILNNNPLGNNGDEFINEVASMGKIHHVNVARLVGFCADGPNRALVYEYLQNETLEKFVFSKNGKRVVLGWERLQDIALGIAKGMEYLHHDCEQQILHFDIKPQNILLDDNFVPKISDFGLAKLCSKEKSVVTMNESRGTRGYIAPEVASRNFGKPSSKSDVYSFGILLLEMVGGRRGIYVNVENVIEWVYNNQLDQRGEMRIEIEEGGEKDDKIAKKLTIVALQCIQWHPKDRPSMKVVVQLLEGDEDNLIVPPNPFASADGTKKIGTKPVQLEIISEAE